MNGYASEYVHDTGKGIAMGDFNRIFDRFYQIEGSSESQKSGAKVQLLFELSKGYNLKFNVYLDFSFQ